MRRYVLSLISDYQLLFYRGGLISHLQLRNIAIIKKVTEVNTVVDVD